MECLSGADLGALLRDTGKLPVADAVDYVLQACEAIAEAHELGVVHRDLKPANLFLTTRVDGSPCVKVLDFGVSKTTVELPDDDPDSRRLSPAEPLDETAPPSVPSAIRASGGLRVASSVSIDQTAESARDASGPRGSLDLAALASSTPGGITMTQAFLGSPKYVAPEQIRSARDADSRADIWALGVILYELVSGAPPFGGETLEQVSKAILEREPTPLRMAGALGLDRVLARCLAKDRTARYSKIQELAEALVPFASEEGRMSAARVTRMASGRRAPSLSTPGVSTRTPHPPLTPPKRPRRALFVGLAAFVVTTAAGVAIRSWRSTAHTLSTALPVADESSIAPSRVSAAPPSSPTAAVYASAPAARMIEPPVAVAPTTPTEAALDGGVSPPPAATHHPHAPARPREGDPLGIQGGSLFDNRK
jgi:serine/threonine-protein kinase